MAVCEWVSVASVVECFEWSVYWKSAVEVEVHFQTDRDSLLNSQTEPESKQKWCQADWIASQPSFSCPVADEFQSENQVFRELISNADCVIIQYIKQSAHFIGDDVDLRFKGVGPRVIGFKLPFITQ